MTDSEIIKAVECCSKADCDHCPNDDKNNCIKRTVADALALIKRQQAEIEKLKPPKKCPWCGQLMG